MGNKPDLEKTEIVKKIEHEVDRKMEKEMRAVVALLQKRGSRPDWFWGALSGTNPVRSLRKREMAGDVQASQVSLSCKNPDYTLEHYVLTKLSIQVDRRIRSELFWSSFLYPLLCRVGIHGLSWNELKKGAKMPINVYRGRFNEMLLREIESKRYQLNFSVFSI